MKISYANRGMDLESEINDTNHYYLDIDKAVVYKKPTPITISKVNYKENRINEGYFRTPSTTDYNGLYKGYYIDFEAKETVNKTSFPLQNIHPHQIEHLKRVVKHGGIGFLIIRFKTINETYYLDANELIKFIKGNTAKSIPIDYFRANGHIIKDKFQPRVDYLSIVDLYIGVKNEKKI